MDATGLRCAGPGLSCRVGGGVHESRVKRGLLGALLVAALWAWCLAAAPAGAAPPRPICPSRQDVCVDRLLVQMQRNDEHLACSHNAAFALLYRRTTEGIRDAIRAGDFSDRPFWNQITTAFGRYYLDAFGAWRRGAASGTPGAWRIAFNAAKGKRVSTLGDLFLGINAHVNHDLAFVYYRLGARSHADHLQVNAVLTRVSASVLPEIAATLDPTVAGQSSSDPALELDIFAWRELAWHNARRLATAPDAAARHRIAAGIERHSVAMARRIRAAFTATPAVSRTRDAFCRRVHGR
jgi:Family of unknown function (DUF5995)